MKYIAYLAAQRCWNTDGAITVDVLVEELLFGQSTAVDMDPAIKPLAARAG
jgi:hypothetical protein